MRKLLLGLFVCASVNAQTLQFFVDGTNAPLSATLPYQFPDTAVGDSNTVVIRISNVSGTSVPVWSISLSASPTSSVTVSGFTIPVELPSRSLAPGASATFAVTFAPLTAGPGSAYLLWQSTISGPYSIISSLEGSAIAAPLKLTCRDSIAPQCDGVTLLQPGNPTPISFGADPTRTSRGVSVGSTYQITFTLTNSSAVAVAAPSIPSPTPLSGGSVFSVDTSHLPAQIPANSSASFTVTFAPLANFTGPSDTATATLMVGTSAYAISGVESGAPGTPAGSDPLQVTCAYQKPSPCQMSGNTVQFGPDPSTLTAIFSVSNPNQPGTAYADITLQTPPSISGANFTMTTPTLAPTNATSPGSFVQAGAITIQPGYTLSFTVRFAASSATTATLNITTGISYTLIGETYPGLGTAQSDLPGLTLMCGNSPCMSQTFTSQQTVPATLQVSAAGTGSVNLTMNFQPLQGLQDDPGITFTKPFNIRTLPPIFFTPSSVTGAFQSENGQSQPQSQFTFQTGTTAGTIAITATDSVTQQTITWPIDVLPSKVQITSVTAVRQSPNLVITMTGYDNTYSIGSAGPLSFSFATTAGILSATADASSAFHQYFFTNDTAGGAFSLQASFAVTGGDVTQITSVVANLTNSVGQTSLTQAFQ